MTIGRVAECACGMYAFPLCQCAVVIIARGVHFIGWLNSAPVPQLDSLMHIYISGFLSIHWTPSVRTPHKCVQSTQVLLGGYTERQENTQRTQRYTKHPVEPEVERIKRRQSVQCWVRTQHHGIHVCDTTVVMRHARSPPVIELSFPLRPKRPRGPGTGSTSERVAGSCGSLHQIRPLGRALRTTLWRGGCRHCRPRRKQDG